LESNVKQDQPTKDGTVTGLVYKRSVLRGYYVPMLHSQTLLQPWNGSVLVGQGLHGKGGQGKKNEDWNTTIPST